jgi:hypothetical protein
VERSCLMVLSINKSVLIDEKHQTTEGDLKCRSAVGDVILTLFFS